MRRNGIDDPLIMIQDVNNPKSNEGPGRIAEKYAWEAAGYFWSVLTNANNVASNPNVHPDRLTEIVNKKTDTYEERANIYYNDVVPILK